jgi:ribonucleoside-diphosphate reductase, adenosylcobalamin-dependent
MTTATAATLAKVKTQKKAAKNADKPKSILTVSDVRKFLRKHDEARMPFSIWKTKYALRDGVKLIELLPEETVVRFVNGVFEKDKKAAEFALKMAEVILSGLYMPGGRIVSGAGTGRLVTLINCFVSGLIEDSLRSEWEKGGPTVIEHDDYGPLPRPIGIFEAVKHSGLTMQQGGGIGHDFSNIRPRGAYVESVGADASGPLSFMEMWDSMCRTIMSAGERRGAMMGTLRCDHPDVEAFIAAKHRPGVLTQFNMSILVTDPFMEAVKMDGDWELGHPKRPADESRIVRVTTRDGKPWYVWKVVRAKELWETILRSTYEYAEPGVIFIDRINVRNNLWYAEEISCTNPCGEQPLPPYSICNLGAINLGSFVEDPFGPNPTINLTRLRETANLAIRFQDNVLDVTNYPLPEQRAEAMRKRRVGLGIMGLGNALQMLKLRYGSTASVEATEKMMETIAIGAFEGSVELARERGAFPLFDAEKFLQGDLPSRLPPELKAKIRKYGMRNGVLLTVAPTGTTAIYATLFSDWAKGSDSLSGGLEPVFASRYIRKIRQKDDTTIDVPTLDASFVAYCRVNGLDPLQVDLSTLPDYMATAQDLSVDDHLAIQAACQNWVDASISKTINVPEDYDFEDFQKIYMRAYDMGLKGCTTYRPSDVRGSVLSVEKTEQAPAAAPAAPTLVGKPKRPPVIDSVIIKEFWPQWGNAMYMTVGHSEDQSGRVSLSEIFINTKNLEAAEMTSAVTILMSKLGTVSKDHLIDALGDLQKIQSADGGNFIGARFFPSVISLIATRLLERIAQIDAGILNRAQIEAHIKGEEIQELAAPATKAGKRCHACGSTNTRREEGCLKCDNCGESKCG